MEKSLQTNALPGVLLRPCIILSCPLAPGVMQLLYGGQLAANYLLYREVNTPGHVCETGGEGGKTDPLMGKCTDVLGL